MSRTIPLRAAAIGATLSLLLASAPCQERDTRLFDVPFVGFDAGDYSTARYTSAACVADFDNDGDPDVATASWPSHARVTVLRNDGGGMFAAPAVYALPLPALELACGDFDGDGYVDLVAANTGASYQGTSVAYLQNRGDGTFEAARSFPVGSGPVGLAPADFDRDGRLDLAVANWGFLGSGATLSLLRNRGAAELFAPAVDFAAGAAPFRAVAADLDGDQWVDVAIANGKTNVAGTARLNVLWNDRQSGFGPRLELAGFHGGLSFLPTVLAADTDLDGDRDLLYGDAALNGFARFANLGGRAFGAASTTPTTPFAGGPDALAVGDLTADGWPDVVGTLHDNQGWVLWPSAGGGALGAPRRLSAGEGPHDVELADVEGDGDLDPLIVARDSLEVTVHFNPGDGEFEARPFHPVTPLFSFFFDHGDVDADGDRDLVNAGAPDFEILRNRGDGTFEPAERYRPPSAPLDLKLRDLDGDGDPDLLWNERNAPYRFGTALNDGTGRFANGTMWPVATCGYFRSEVDAFDLDGDGDLDVVQIESLGCPGVSFRRVFISENFGGATFGLATSIALNPNARSVAGGDFDHDGHLDLAITGQPTTILLGRGDLTFEKLSGAQLPGINVVAEDFDRDGHLDLAIALQRNVAPFVESMAIQLGRGDGTFGPPVIHLGSHSPNLAQISEIAAGDVDRDGHLDVLCMNGASNDVSIWRGRGDGTFERQVRYGTGKGSLDLALADFTGDAVADLVTYDNTFPPLDTGMQLFAGRARLTVCQPNAGFAGPGRAFSSVCGDALASGASAELLIVRLPGSAAVLGLGLAANPLPVFGGTWVPNPAVLLASLPVGAGGECRLTLLGGGGPVDVYAQAVYLDASLPQGIGFTNALRLQLLP